ncbi:phage terminase large subunit [Oscillospiraceae bacterium]|nr:phage terminase large subunit [Oscillospiraceae bacterium]
MDVRDFSPKQRLVLDWWCDGSPWRDREAIICDGAVRSGKTFCLGLSFFCWAMRRFHGERLALCGRTVASVRRNLWSPLAPVLGELGFSVRELVSQHQVRVAFGGRENTFYFFGGKDEASGALIQGITLAGVLLDEAALMPRSFVEQALARCSVEGAKAWFSCNPEGPEHWFYKEWVLRAEERKALRVRFAMADNPSLSPQVLERYRRSFHGAFYRRFVLGEWAVAEGRVYDFFDEAMVRPVPTGAMEEWRVSCDYGTVNPTSMGLWGRQGEVWYRVDEFYYDARREGRQKTDREYAADLERLAAGRHLRRVVVDPSAASFIACLREEGWPVARADNDVVSGIRVTADLLRRGRLVICAPCRDAVREFSLYCWDQRAVGDRVVKRFDHAMDDIRYFAVSLEKGDGYIGGLSVERTGW